MSHKLLIPCVSTELAQYPEKRVTVSGWIHRVRRLGAIRFIVLRDGEGLLQIRHSGEDAALPPLPPETVVRVTGRVVPETRAPRGVELHEPEFEVLSRAVGPLPVSLGGPTVPLCLDRQLDEAALTLRHPRVRDVFRVQSQLVEGFRKTAPASASSRCTLRRLSPPLRKAGRMSFRCATLTKKPFWPRAHNYTSRCWWACLAGSLRSDWSFVRSRMTPGGTRANIPHWTPRWDSLRTTIR